jgi:hypothetical protein
MEPVESSPCNLLDSLGKCPEEQELSSLTFDREEVETLSVEDCDEQDELLIWDRDELIMGLVLSQ